MPNASRARANLGWNRPWGAAKPDGSIRAARSVSIPRLDVSQVLLRRAVGVVPIAVRPDVEPAQPGQRLAGPLRTPRR